jgi:hypothetical protein
VLCTVGMYVHITLPRDVSCHSYSLVVSLTSFLVWGNDDSTNFSRFATALFLFNLESFSLFSVL